jgi:putative DNA primase/helicase
MTVAALTCHNVKAVGMQIRAILPKATLVFLGEIGVGMKYAEEAALAVNGRVARPVFQEGDKGSDFNDMALLYGYQAVRDSINGAGDAVEEVSRYVQAPLPLVASSALASVSLATQAHVDAQRDEKLQGPTSLYMLTIAASGERKSTCDG